jgi:hypothetical protein
MKHNYAICIGIALLIFSSCRQNIKREITDYKYYDIQYSDTMSSDSLIAVTDEEFLQFGSRVAYISLNGDTVIPFGHFAYFGTDTLVHFATVFEQLNDSALGRQIAIDKNQNILFDLVMFDNGPESFHDGLLRVLRNGKMGYANRFGQIVIPCIYDYAKWFDNGQAEVTFKAKEYLDMEEHRRVESDEWFKIDRKGNKIE